METVTKVVEGMYWINFNEVLKSFRLVQALPLILYCSLL